MAEYREVALAKSKGKGKKPELHHLRIFAGDDATPEKPSWFIEHHYVEDHEPEGHEFTDHNEMLQHVAEHTSTERLDEI